MIDPAFDRVVADLLEQVNLGQTPDDLLQTVYDRLKGLVPFHRVAVAVLEDSGQQLRLVSCRSDAAVALQVGYSDPVAGSSLEELLRTGTPRIINDLGEYLARKPDSRSTRLIVREGMQSNLTLPLLAGGRPVGVLFFSSRQVRSYEQSHVQLLRPIAGPLALALERSRLLSELQERNKELLQANQLKDHFLHKLRQEVRRQTAALENSLKRYRTLTRLGRLLNSSLDARQVFLSTAREVGHLVPCDRMSLVLVDPSSVTRQGFAVEMQDEPRLVELPSRELSGSAAGWVLEHRQRRVAPDLDTARPFAEDRELHALGYRSHVCLPLLCRDRVVGVWGLAARQPEQMSAWDLDLLDELCPLLAVALDNAAAYGEISRLKARLEQENVYLREEVRTGQGIPELVGSGSAMRRLGQAIEQVAGTDATVLILGETGTGKELVARAIHDQSARSKGPFVAENCGVFAEGVVASELFGHEAGAFTGATSRRKGVFEQAHGGTLLLDEVGELSPRVQAALLRVLQEGAFRRVGGESKVAVDVRVLAATHKDLARMVKDGTFREDLYFRLRGATVDVPPLRERPGDIELLIDAFLDEIAARRASPRLTLSREARRAVLAHPWPGNVRELKAEVERWAVFCDGVVEESDLAPEIREGRAPLSVPSAGRPFHGAGGVTPGGNSPLASASDIAPLAEVIDAAERAAVTAALEACEHNLSATARALRIDRNTLKRKMAAWGLREP